LNLPRAGAFEPQWPTTSKPICGAKYALEERDARIAELIVNSVWNVLDLIDQQSPSALEALIDYTKDLEKPGGSPAWRNIVRDALLQHLDYALRESRRRECELYRGITGQEL
jgi:hypothetical protein